MDKNNRDLDALLADVSFRKWVLGPTNESELFWKNWLVQNPDKSVEFDCARLLIRSMRFKEGTITEIEKAELLKRIKATIALHHDKNKATEAVVKPIYSNTTYNKGRKGNKTFTRYFLRYAAILGGAIILALSANLIFGDVDNKSGIQLVKKVNKQGQKSTIFLPDGSVVSLNSSSSIVYPEEFSDGVREVKLNGEAFFQVAMNSKPFIVKLNEMEARVLGTSFNARSFKNSASSISLVTGKLEITTSESNANMILTPGEKATLSSAKALQKSNFSYEEDILWKDGVLYFDKTPIMDAVHRMEQWYGVKFTTVEWPEGYEVTGKFNNESLESVLRSISFTLRFDYKINGNKVDIIL